MYAKKQKKKDFSPGFLFFFGDMPGQAREMLLLALSHHFISEKEFLFLFDASFSKNPSFPYEDYDRFDLDARDETDFLHRFRVRKMDISRLAHALMILRVCAAINDQKPTG